jgi:hypothetical protein
MKFLIKLKKQLPDDPAIPLLGIYLKECKQGYNKDICTPTLLIIAKLWNDTIFPTSEECIKKMWCLYKSNFLNHEITEILSFEDEWIKLKSITLSEFPVSDSQRLQVLSHMWLIVPVQMQEILYM